MNAAPARPRILCVDDEDRNLELLAAVLVPLGCEALFARTGREALALIEKAPPAVVLLDVMLPGMSGFDVLAKIRAAEATRALPVVMVTALSETGPRVEALEKGADDFISKPFEKAEVQARVRSLLRLEHYRAQLAEKEKLELVLEAVTDGVCVCGPGLLVKTLNDAARRLLGAGAEGAPLAELLAKEFPGAPRAEALAAPFKLVFELERPETPAAAAAFYEVTGLPVRNRLGEPAGLVFTFKNTTARRKAEALKRDFLSLISHKLRTPITALTMGVSLLLEGGLGALAPAQREIIAGLAGKTGWLEKLFIGMLEFLSAAAAGGPPLSCAAALKAAERALAGFGGAAITVKNALAGPAALPLGQKELELLLRNLIGNAVRFGGAAPKILVELGGRDGGFELSVSDDGPGIPPEERERIFEPCSRAGKDFTGNAEGAGLGLAVVKRLAQLRGGSVSVRSRPGEGARFTVTLPAAGGRA